MSARAHPRRAREGYPREPRGRTPLGAPRASDSYFLINNFNDAPRQFRYKARTHMQIPVSVGRHRIVIYYVRRGSCTGPRAHAGVPADHFSYQRSLRAGRRCAPRPARPRFVDFTRVVVETRNLPRFCDLAKDRSLVIRESTPLGELPSSNPL